MTIKRYSTIDIGSLPEPYEGRILDQPRVRRRNRDNKWGMLEIEEVSFSVAVGDGDLPTDAPESLRGCAVAFDRYDAYSGVIIPEFGGVFQSGELSAAGILHVKATNLDLAALKTELCARKVDTLTWPRAVDFGRALAAIFGNVPKVPLCYVHEEVLGASGGTFTGIFDYILGHGELLISDLPGSGVFRDGPGDTLYSPANFFEFENASGNPATSWANACRYDLYPGFTALRADRIQLNYQNGRHQLWADVVAKPGFCGGVPCPVGEERSFQRALRVLITHAPFGLGRTVEAASFAAVEPVLQAVGGLFCDGAILEPTQAQFIFEQLLMPRGMRLGMKPGSTDWTLAVDTPRTAVRLVLRDGRGYGIRNMFECEPRTAAGLDEATRSVTLEYRPDYVKGAYVHRVTRALQNIGEPLPLENAFIRSSTTADKTVDFLGKRILSGERRVRVLLPLEARRLMEGELVRLTYAPLGFDNELFEAYAVDKGLLDIGAELRRVSPADYVYTAGTLPPDELLGTFDDYTRTLPAAVTNLEVVGSGAELSAEGVWTSFQLVEMHLPTVNFDRAVLRFRKTGTTDWSGGLEVRGSGTVRVKVPGLVTSQAYDWTTTSVNSFGRESLVNAILFNQLAPKDLVPPTVPTLQAPTVGTGASVALRWTASPEADTAEYRVYRNTVNNPGTATAIGDVRATRFVDTAVVLGTTYFYWVTAIDASDNESAKSAGVSATPTGAAQGTAPATPGTPTLINVTTYQASDGATLAAIALNVPAMPAEGAILNLLYRQQGQVAWQIADQRSTGGGTARVDDLTPAVTYQFACQAFNGFGLASGISALLTQLMPNDPDAPSIPTGLAPVLGTGATVALDWNDNPERDLADYGVFRNTVNNPATATLIARVQASRFVDTTGVLGTQYWYWITARDRTGNESVKTPTPVSATPTGAAQGTVPGTPSAPTLNNAGIYASNEGTAQAFAIVNVPAMPVEAAYLNILVRVFGQTPWTIADQRTLGGGTARINGLTPGINYEIAVQAFNAFGLASLVSGQLSHTASGDTSAPTAPTSVTLRKLGKAIEISVNATLPADWGITEIFRNTSNNAGTATRIARGKSLSFLDENVAYDVTYFYWAKLGDNTYVATGNVANLSAFSPGSSVLVQKIGGSQIGSLGSGNIEDTAVIAVKRPDLLVNQQVYSVAAQSTVQFSMSGLGTLGVYQIETGNFNVLAFIVSQSPSIGVALIQLINFATTQQNGILRLYYEPAGTPVLPPD